MTSKKKPAAKAAAKKQAAPKKATTSTSSVATAVQAAKAREQADLAFARLTNAQARALELRNAQTEARIRYENAGKPDPESDLSQSASSAALFGSVVSAETVRTSSSSPASPLSLDDALKAQDRGIEFSAELLTRLEQVLACLLRPVLTNNGEGVAPSPEPVSSDLAKTVRGHTARIANNNARVMALIDRIDLGSN